jgi:RNA polymerase sigma-70 factor, ECF subfamily
MGQERPALPDIGELFALYHQRVARWARYLGGPLIEVEDAVQEVFLIAHRRMRQFDDEDQLRAWLHRVTENVVREQRRTMRRGRTASPRSDDRPVIAERIADVQPLQPEIIARDEELHLVYEVLAQMSERNRTLFILFEIEELSGQEIADMRGVKLGTLWVLLHRARADFARRFAKMESRTEEKS